MENIKCAGQSSNANTQLDSIVDHLCCKICYCPYTEKGNNEPKVLKCGHTVCRQCSNMIYTKQRQVLLCPFCKSTDRTHPRNLPKNFDIVNMVPHYPNLPPNQKPHNSEFEKMKVQWVTEREFLIQVKENSKQATDLVTQAEKQLEQWKRHAEVAASNMQHAESALKATEDSLRLFVDLHPDDPTMAAFAENLPPLITKPLSILEDIRRAKLANLEKRQGRDSLGAASQSTSGRRDNFQSNNNARAGLLQEIRGEAPQMLSLELPIQQHPHPLAGSSSSNDDHLNGDTFARNIAEAAARMHQLNNPPPPPSPVPERRATFSSPREAMLALLRGGRAGGPH